MLFVLAIIAAKPELVVNTGHTNSIQSVALSPDGAYVLTASSDNTAKLWSMATGTEVRTFVGHTKYMQTVRALTQGKQNPTSRKENLESDFRLY